MQVRSLGQEDPLEEGKAMHFSILACRIPWTEKPGGLQTTVSQRVRHDWSDVTHTARLLSRSMYQWKNRWVGRWMGKGTCPHGFNRIEFGENPLCFLLRQWFGFSLISLITLLLIGCFDFSLGSNSLAILIQFNSAFIAIIHFLALY